MALEGIPLRFLQKVMGEKSFQASIGEEIKKCPDCGSSNITVHDDEIVCNKCGSVIEE